MRVLIVEDEGDLRDRLVELISRQGMLADGVARLDEAAAALATTAFDLLLVDRALPDGDGLALLRGRGLSGMPRPPAIVLTARDATSDIVQGLDGGADDYLTKPFEPDELLARVRVLLRRPARGPIEPLRIGTLSVEVGAGRVEVRGRDLPLPRREYLILEALARRHGRIVTRQSLDDAVYGFDDVVQSNTLEAQISRLRRRLREAGADVTIHVMRGVGYMLRLDAR